MTEEIRKILEEISNDKNYSNFIDSQNGGAEDYLLLEKIKGKQLLNYITNLQKELDQYKNNWEELKKCINHYAIDEEDGSKIYSVEEIELLEILDKMKELEEDK